VTRFFIRNAESLNYTTKEGKSRGINSKDIKTITPLWAQFFPDKSGSKLKSKALVLKNYSHLAIEPQGPFYQ